MSKDKSRFLWFFQGIEPINQITDLPTAEKPPAAPHEPITTRRGRVVYNRKKHRFTKKDLERIERSLAADPATTPCELIEFYLRRVADLAKEIAPGFVHNGIDNLMELASTYWCKVSQGRYDNLVDMWIGVFEEMVLPGVRRLLEDDIFKLFPVVRQLIMIVFPKKDQPQIEAPED